MSVLWGLFAAANWGAGDYVLALVSRRTGLARTIVGVQALCCIFWAAVLVAHPRPPHWNAAQCALMSVAAFAFVGGMWCFQRAFELGEVAVVAPVAASYVLVTAGLDAIQGVRPSASQTAAALLLLGGVALISMGPGEPKSSGRVAGIPQAAGAALCFGVLFWVLNKVTAPGQLGVAWPLLTLKVAGLAAGLALLSRERAPTVPSPPSRFRYAQWTACAACDSLAWTGFLLAARGQNLAVVTALVSLSSAVTVALAAVLLKERLARRQWVGVTLVLVGICGASYGRDHRSGSLHPTTVTALGEETRGATQRPARGRFG